jgi:hypothetical protein
MLVISLPPILVAPSVAGAHLGPTFGVSYRTSPSDEWFLAARALPTFLSLRIVLVIPSTSTTYSTCHRSCLSKGLTISTPATHCPSSITQKNSDTMIERRPVPCEYRPRFVQHATESHFLESPYIDADDAGDALFPVDTAGKLAHSHGRASLS